MVDELERLRRLRQDAPSPDDSWVEDTRSQILAMADEEAAASSAAGASGASVLERLADGLLAAFRRPAVAAAAALVLIGAIGVGVWQFTAEERPGATVVQAPTAEGTPSPTRTGRQLAASCTGADGAYTVSFPDDWHTNAGNGIGACRVFDGEPVSLEENIGGGAFGPIAIELIDGPFEDIVDPHRSADVLSSEPTSVDGFDGVRQTIEYTGETSLPRGMLAYRYLVDLGDQTLLAIAYELPDEPFQDNKELLDDMVSSLELRPTG